MQTFAPFTDFISCAEALDDRRLGKQRVEVVQILETLLGLNSGSWASHPAVLMWKGYEPALACYGGNVCHTWKERGFKDTCFGKIDKLRRQAFFYGSYEGLDTDVSLRTWEFVMPPWWYSAYFHYTHCCNLIRKNEAFYYAKLKPFVAVPLDTELTDMEFISSVRYFWPVQKTPT